MSYNVLLYPKNGDTGVHPDIGIWNSAGTELLDLILFDQTDANFDRTYPDQEELTLKLQALQSGQNSVYFQLVAKMLIAMANHFNWDDEDVQISAENLGKVQELKALFAKYQGSPKTVSMSDIPLAEDFIVESVDELLWRANNRDPWVGHYFAADVYSVVKFTRDLKEADLSYYCASMC